MATLFLKTGEPGKQEKRYMDKAAVRKFLERKDLHIGKIEAEAAYLTIVNDALKKRVKFLNKVIMISWGVFIGHAIIFAIIWYSTH